MDRKDKNGNKEDKLQMPFKSLEEDLKRIEAEEAAKANAAKKAREAREAKANAAKKAQTARNSSASSTTKPMSDRERKQRYGSFLGESYRPKTGSDSLKRGSSSSGNAGTSGSSRTDHTRKNYANSKKKGQNARSSWSQGRTASSSSSNRSKSANSTRSTGSTNSARTTGYTGNTASSRSTGSTRFSENSSRLQDRQQGTAGRDQTSGRSSSGQRKFGNSTNTTANRYGGSNTAVNRNTNNSTEVNRNRGSNTAVSRNNGSNTAASRNTNNSTSANRNSAINTTTNRSNRSGTAVDNSNHSFASRRNNDTGTAVRGNRGSNSSLNKNNESGIRKSFTSRRGKDNASAKNSRRPVFGNSSHSHNISENSFSSSSSSSKYSDIRTSRVGRHSYSNANRGRTVHSPLAQLDDIRSRSYDRETGRVNRRVQKRRRTFASIIAVIILALLLRGAVYEVQKIQMNRSEQAQREKDAKLTRKETIKKAKRVAAGYDYDGAIELIKSIKDYSSDKKLTDLIAEWKSTKETLVEYKAEDATHIFYHTLVVDADLAFNGGKKTNDNYKLWMTTIDEFDRITQTMYDEGYVLVDLQDFYEETTDEDGNVHFTEKSIYLPADKKPFILSLDDLSYYHCYTGYGMADKLVLDDNGKITCEYTDRDGTVKTGSYDCVPRINDFMTEHPDGAYHNSRGTIALTGYNGVFGYRTDYSYVTQENIDDDKKQWLKDHPDYDYDEECAEATAIANELKAEGWTFASHTWGHLRVGKLSLEKLEADTERWLNNVEPIIGKTDIIIFAHGQDLSSSDEYELDNPKFVYLKSMGFNVFLNVDSHEKTMKVHDTYVHGGRRNLDGYRLWHDAMGDTSWTTDLFDASQILDSIRTDMPETDE